MPTTKANFLFADVDGQKAETAFYFDGIENDPTTGETDAMKAALIGISAAKLVGINNVVIAGDVVGAADANAYDCGDKAKVYGRSASGLDVETSIPCPMESLFNADGETVNISTGVGATLKAALEAAWKARDGSAVTVTAIERTRPTRKA
jgi:hypothetical protein